MSDEKIVDEIQQETNELDGLLREIIEYRRTVDALNLQIREMETQLADERHEFQRKQLGMSTLVAVLLDQRVDDAGDVTISKEQFVKLATAGEATAEDNAMLRRELEKLREELHRVKARDITHRMALEEATGIRIAELIQENDGLRDAVRDLTAGEGDRCVDPQEGDN
jgi:hypothetical protein